MRKFSVIRVRQKISYMAFIKLNTVNESIVKAILQSYRDLVGQGEIKALHTFQQIENTFQQILCGSLKNSLVVSMRLNMKNNNERNANLEMNLRKIEQIEA